MRRRREASCSGRQSLLFLVALQIATINASYTCTSVGKECTAANRIYASGAYSVRATLEAACTNNPACIQYDWNEVSDIGFQCSSTATRDDDYNEYIVCVKPLSPPRDRKSVV